MNKPELLTDNEVNTIFSGAMREGHGRYEIASAISDARDKQWEAMLSAQKPVAWRVWNGGLQDDGNVYLYSEDGDGSPLYAAPQPAQQELLREASRILHEALRAIGKIKVERVRGAGYFHAEVDWLVQEEQNIVALRRAIEAAPQPAQQEPWQSIKDPAKHGDEILRVLENAVEDMKALERREHSHPEMLASSLRGQLNKAIDLRTIEVMKSGFRNALTQPAQQERDTKTWCAYIAGIIGCYLGDDDESPRVRAIAGIIERRMWSLPAPQPAQQDELLREVLDCGATEYERMADIRKKIREALHEQSN